jgi:hypothetical protein
MFICFFCALLDVCSRFGLSTLLIVFWLGQRFEASNAQRFETFLMQWRSEPKGNRATDFDHIVCGYVILQPGTAVPFRASKAQRVSA